MRNLRIGGIILMLMGAALDFLTASKWDTFAGAMAGAGFGLLIYSFLKISRRRI